MIVLTKLNGEEFVLNCRQIQMIELIPESKIVLMNKDIFIVKETTEEIIKRSIDYEASIINGRTKGL